MQRRDFLRTATVGAGGAALVPGFTRRLLAGTDPAAPGLTPTGWDLVPGILARIRPSAQWGRPVVHYIGAGWTASGDLRGPRDWWRALDALAARLDAPIRVTLPGAAATASAR